MAWIIQWLLASYSSVDNNYTLTVDHTKVGSWWLSNFPIVVNTNDIKSGITLTEAQSIRIYNSSMTELARDIVTKDKMTFKADSLSSSVDTVFNIVMDWVSADYGVSDTYGRNNVYTAYKAYYDFASGNSNDRTWNGYNGTDSNMSYSGDYASFNGTNSKIALPWLSKITGSGVIQVKFMPTTMPASWYTHILYYDWSFWMRNILLWINGPSTYTTYFWKGNWSSSSDTFLTAWSFTKDAINYTTYHRNGTTLTAYINWASVWSQWGSYSWGSTSNTICLWSDWIDGSWYLFTWRMYEAKVSETTFSSSRIATEYNNQSSPSTFYTIS